MFAYGDELWAVGYFSNGGAWVTRSTDNGATWAELDAAHRPPSLRQSADGYGIAGDRLYVLTMPNALTVKIVYFDLANGAWVTDGVGGLVGSDHDPEYAATSLSVRSDHSMFFTYEETGFVRRWKCWDGASWSTVTPPEQLRGWTYSADRGDGTTLVVSMDLWESHAAQTHIVDEHFAITDLGHSISVGDSGQYQRPHTPRWVNGRRAILLGADEGEWGIDRTSKLLWVYLDTGEFEEIVNPIPGAGPDDLFIYAASNRGIEAFSSANYVGDTYQWFSPDGINWSREKALTYPGDDWYANSLHAVNGGVMVDFGYWSGTYDHWVSWVSRADDRANDAPNGSAEYAETFGDHFQQYWYTNAPATRVAIEGGEYAARFAGSDIDEDGYEAYYYQVPITAGSWEGRSLWCKFRIKGEAAGAINVYVVTSMADFADVYYPPAPYDATHALYDFPITPEWQEVVLSLGPFPAEHDLVTLNVDSYDAVIDFDVLVDRVMFTTQDPTDWAYVPPNDSAAIVPTPLNLTAQELGGTSGVSAAVAVAELDVTGQSTKAGVIRQLPDTVEWSNP